MDGDDTPTLADYLGLIRRRFVIIALAGVMGALVGLAYLAKAEPGYESTARVVLEQVPDSPGISGVGGGISPATTLTATQRSILRSDEVAQRAADRLGDGATAEQLRDYAAVEILPDSLTMDVSYQADDPAIAQAGAQALVDSYLELRTEQEEARRSEVVGGLVAQLDDLNEARDATSKQLEDVDPDENPTTETVLAAQLNSQFAEELKLKTELTAWQRWTRRPATGQPGVAARGQHQPGRPGGAHRSDRSRPGRRVRRGAGS
ncbi:MAG: Wzz/FepE/Etk N-terminal domain-containing protein [Microthrixaceae bacterium]